MRIDCTFGLGRLPRGSPGQRLGHCASLSAASASHTSRSGWHIRRRTGAVDSSPFSESLGASRHAQIMPHERRSRRDSGLPFSLLQTLLREPVRLPGCHSQQSSQRSVPLPIDPRLTRLDEKRVRMNNPDDVKTTYNVSPRPRPRVTTATPGLFAPRSPPTSKGSWDRRRLMKGSTP